MHANTLRFILFTTLLYSSILLSCVLIGCIKDKDDNIKEEKVVALKFSDFMKQCKFFNNEGRIRQSLSLDQMIERLGPPGYVSRNYSNNNIDFVQWWIQDLKGEKYNIIDDEIQTPIGRIHAKVTKGGDKYYVYSIEPINLAK